MEEGRASSMAQFLARLVVSKRVNSASNPTSRFTGLEVFSGMGYYNQLVEVRTGGVMAQ